jgi:TonB family protein
VRLFDLTLAVALLSSLPRLALAQGLGGLGAPGGLVKIDPKAAAFEQDLLAALNAARTRAGTEAVGMDERLRTFARREAELAAKGSPEAKSAEQRLKTQGLAPFGHRIQYGFGTQAKGAVDGLLKDAAVKTALLAEFARAGVGAFLVPDEKPYFQFALVLVAEPDPMAGRPGLSPAQTDAVMNAAQGKLKLCYDAALKRDPNARGDVIFALVIGAKGQVDSHKLLKSLGDADFDRCALQVASALSFPAPYKGKPVSLNHPVRFTPPQGDKKVGRLTDGQKQGPFIQAGAELKACYDQSAKDKPQLAGTITIGLTVSEEGKVTALDVVHDEPKAAALTACVLERVRQMRFAAPEFNAALSFTYPLRFAPGGTK